MDSKNYHKMSDEELVELCKSYDDVALQTLIKRMESVISGCVSSFSDSRFESEDLMQEGLVACFRAVLSFDGEKGASFKTYVSVCVKNALKNFVRKKNNVFLSADKDFVPFGDETVGSTTTEDEYISSENYKDLRESLKRVLSPAEYTVFSLFVDGMSYSEIAEKTGQSFKSVDSALQRVRKKLKSIMS